MGCGRSRRASRATGVSDLPPEPRARTRRHRWSALARPSPRSAWILLVYWMVVLLEGAAWAAMRLGDAMVIPTLLAYGARWIWLLPVVALAPLALWRRSLGLPLALALAVWLLGIMQFQLPHFAVAPACCRVTIVTLNGNQAARPESFREVVDAAQADIVAMQEWEQTSTANALPGWTVDCDGELCLGSRRPMSKLAVLGVPTPNGSRAMVMTAEITTDAGPVAFFSIHLDTVRRGIEPMLHAGFGATDELRENLVFRDRESRAAASWILAHGAHPAIVAGDFNMPTDSAIYRRNWSSWSDAFEWAGTGLGHTKFTSLWGIRIDHVLFDANWQAVRAQVGPDVGSDHRPLIVTLQRAASTVRGN
jgi:vancomycin resistance protein VanJ